MKLCYPLSVSFSPSSYPSNFLKKKKKKKEYSMDLDDLLGGGAAVVQAGAGEPDPMAGLLGGDASAGGAGGYDLLGGGGGGPVAGAGDLDDLLFGGSGGGGLDDALLGGGGGGSGFWGSGTQQQEQSAPPTRTAKKLSISPAQPQSEALQKYVQSRDAQVYFLRFVSVLDNPHEQGSRKRIAFLATHKDLLLMSTPSQTERTIPIQNIIGIILCVTEAPRRFGSAGQEVHVLMHVRGAKDLYLVLGREEGNSEMEGSVLAISQGFVAVLTALCASFGDTLPVSTLKRECESLESFFSPILFADDDLRAKFHQALAARTMQLSECAVLERDERCLDIAIATLKTSEKGSTVGQLTQEIKNEEDKIALDDRREIDAKKEQVKVAAKVRELREALAAEEQRRMSVIREQSASAAQEQLLKHLAEYKLQKKNHGREMLRLQTVTSFLERYARETQQASYDARNVALRIDDLTDMLQYLQGAASQRTELNSKVVKALTENRRRTVQIKDLIKKHEEHLATIEDADNLDALPVAVLDCAEPENITPILINLENAVAGAGSSHSTSSTRMDVQAIASPTVANAVVNASSVAPIDLDDDDDDDI